MSTAAVILGSDPTASTLIRVDHAPAGAVAVLACEVVREHQVALLSGQLTELCEAARGRLVISLEQVRELTCGFIQVLARLAQRCRDLGGRLVIFGLCQDLRQLLRSTGLDHVFTLAGARDAALTLLDTPADARPPSRLGRFLGRAA